MLLRLFIGLVSIMVWTGSGLATETASVSKDTPTVAEQDHARAASQEVGEYRIGAEDMLDISVWNNSAISRTVPVSPTVPLTCDRSVLGQQSDEMATIGQARTLRERRSQSRPIAETGKPCARKK